MVKYSLLKIDFLIGSYYKVYVITFWSPRMRQKLGRFLQVVHSNSGILVFHDSQLWQKIWQKIGQTNNNKNNYLKSFDLISQQQPSLIWSPMWPSRHVLNERSFKWITNSHTLYWFQKLPKSRKWSGVWTKIRSTLPIQHRSWWPHWLGVRLQISYGCCWEIKSHWRQLF